MSDFVNTRTSKGDQATLDALIANTLTELKEDGVRALGARSLYKNVGLTLIDFPSVTSAGEYALSGCTNLNSVNLAALTSVPQYMFAGDTAITVLSLPEATSVQQYAFQNVPTSLIKCASRMSVGSQVFRSIRQERRLRCSQISQVLALASANELDHFVKEKLHIKYYGRYMDDGYLIHHDKKYLAHCLEEIQAVCDKLGIVLNRKKTKIAKLSRGFTFLKVRFYLTDSGKVVKKIYKRSITKMRRKLKAFRRFVDAGILTMEDVGMSMQSWTAYASNFDAYYTICNMQALYYALFGNFKGGRRK